MESTIPDCGMNLAARIVSDFPRPLSRGKSMAWPDRGSGLSNSWRRLEGIGKSGERIDGVQLGGFDETGDDGPVLASVEASEPPAFVTGLDDVAVVGQPVQ